ncbi:hypothetical protein ABFS82_04G132300 [Erythranthe guttata]|uniref:WUSCHEL-related homeobox 1-like n=1 Tax=Erythranthe guttata TaxID=4155 RepID=UPI00064DBAFC|nr:PREDICTED: WUSCHEL-related homeobox 1-like [Erythranthe guttata]|eukprot:XP_012853221.1 PREDICTED: WUSCHEL-related homeobox 1-like [Erythranthe guttata]
MMWMMGCNDGGDFDSIQDPFTGRKLRPLMPRPAATAAAAAASTPPCFAARIHGTDLLALNHHLAAMAEQNKRELNTQQVVVSSRWNPTPEQLQTLEELYRRGTRTPSAEQIQQITAQLRRYGKIEGKNVFYWFQNHKARERQKRRRHLESLCDEHQPHHHNNNNNIQINDTAQKRQEPAAGGNRTAFEVEQTKNWASLTNSSTTNPEKSGEMAAECKLGSDGWVQFDEEDENDDPDETQQRRNATWQMMHLSCSSSISPTTLHSSLTSSSAATPTMEMHHHHHPDFINIFFDPHQNLGRSGGGGGGGGGVIEETQTLQLFPLESSGGGGGGGQDEEEEEGWAGVNSVTPPYKFFEFLPVKN